MKVEVPEDFSVLKIQEFPCYVCGLDCRAETAQNYDTEEEKIFLAHTEPACDFYKALEGEETLAFIKEAIRKKVIALRKKAEKELIGGVPIIKVGKDRNDG